jgi:aspartyl-tRNA(Asn)/glutamyl-tRNA(Gln) amidotransferase subunit A
MTIHQAAASLRAGEITSTELTRVLLDKIAALNPTLGAYIRVIPEHALSEAAAADALFARGIDRDPLQGIPYAAKDIIATSTAPTTGNSVVLDPAWGEGYDATVIEKMREAGAVLLGKTVLNEFALGMPDADKPFPMPQNPWDLPRSAAGSSSGTGIAVASGLALGGLGTDTGGSTRGPSSFNGSTGMKQTFGRVSKFGCVPLGYSLDGINPMARSAYDCALMLNVLAGYDPKDPTTVDVPVPDYTAGLSGSVAGIRIGVPIPYFFEQPALDAETKAAVLQAIDTLREMGAVVTEIEVPYAAEAKTANTVIMAGEAYAYHRPDLAARFDDYGRYTSESLGRGALYSAADYVQAQRFRSFFRAAMTKVFETVDVIVTPTSIGPATLRSEMDPAKRIAEPSFTGLWNLAGLPAMALPCGFSSSVLPLSMQLIGKAFDEATVFQVGDAYQRVTDFHLRVPTHAQVAVAV